MQRRRTNATITGAALAVVLVLAALIGSRDLGPARATHSASTVDKVAVDTSVAGNTATLIGPTTSCVIIPSVGQTTQVDVVVGPAGIPTDRPLIGIAFDLTYGPAIVQVNAESHGFLLTSKPGSNIFAAGDETLGLPDVDGSFNEATTDVGPIPGSSETGQGVLSRITLQAVGTGTTALTLTNLGLIDTQSELIPFGPVVNATVIVGAGSCADSDADNVIDTLDLCPGTGVAQPVDANGCSNPQVDADGDGICNAGAPSGGPAGCTGSDNCPNTANTNQLDSDGDGRGNACDLCPSTAPAAVVDTNGCSQAQVDPDADGICSPGAPSGGPLGCTGSDNCPNNANTNQLDADGDGRGNACDACPGTTPSAAVDGNGCASPQVDADQDGICNPSAPSAGPPPPCSGSDNCPNTPNASQTDSDADGVGDACDACPGTAPAATVNSTGCSAAQADTDGDGICDPGKTSTFCTGSDNCPAIANANQLDADADGVGNVCDACPGTAASAIIDQNGCSQGQVDADLDGLCDPAKTSTFCTGADNCPNAANPGQQDFDSDGVGNACDLDVDGDGVANGSDLCSFTPIGALVDVNGCSQAQVDSDDDGVCNPGAPASLCTGTDLCPSTAPAAIVDANGCSAAQVDADSDGVCNPSAPSTGPAPGCTGTDLCPATAPAATIDANGCSQAQVDADADGVCNSSAPSAGPSGCTSTDLCPATAPAATVDANGCSAAQVDGDGDGFCNAGAPSSGPAPGCTGTDNCPSTANPTQANADGDGVGDACDLCPATAPAAAVDANGCSNAQVDQDADGICNPGAPSNGPSGCFGADNCPSIANSTQLDSDGDGIGNACDACPSTTPAAVVDGLGCSLLQVDSDGDGLCNPSAPSTGPAPGCTGADNCASAANPSQADADGDGVGNSCDNCPSTPTGATVDANGCSQTQVDSDADAVCNPGTPPGAIGCTGSDNCPSTPNGPAQAGSPLIGNQTDTDSDGLGNACDSDMDNDGLGNQPTDQCPTFAEDYNGFQDGDGCPDDIDNDGIVSSSDACPFVAEDNDGYLDSDGCPEPDNDNDGVCDQGQAAVSCLGSDRGFYAFPGSGPIDCRNVHEDIDAFHDSDGCPEPDNDNDGKPDPIDFCPATDYTAGPDGISDTGDEPLNLLLVPIQTKEDYDGISDEDGCHDSPTDDYDMDGLTDEVEWINYGTNPVIPDTDGDGILDGPDNCKLTPNASQADTDGDGLGDACDPDNDNDGISGTQDLCPNTAAGDVIDASGCSLAQVDADADGACNAGAPSVGPAPGCTGGDNCQFAANPSQGDADGDTLGDACDADIDGDAVANSPDNCPSVPNAGQANLDGDTNGDACDPDDDADTVNDAEDNCPAVFNPVQSNLDGDGLGDSCDPDLDGDSVCNPSSAPLAPGCAGSDNCPAAVNPDQADFDGDSSGDPCDPDDDNDGAQDSADNCTLLPNPDQANHDFDSAGDACDTDDDNDSVADGADNCQVTANLTQANWDADALGDHCDDSDGDGFVDDSEFQMATQVTARCGNPTTTPPIYSQAWPADLSYSAPFSENRVDILDLTTYIAPVRRLGSSLGDPAYHRRWDLVPQSAAGGAWIDVLDLTFLVFATPPMLNGARALNSECPLP